MTDQPTNPERLRRRLIMNTSTWDLTEEPGEAIREFYRKSQAAVTM